MEQAVPGRHAFLYGLPRKECPVAGLRLVTEDALDKLSTPMAKDAIARTAQLFGRREGPSILPIDYDPQPGQPVLSREELIGRLVSAIPALGEVQMLWGASSGSHIFMDGREERGLRGQRLYLVLEDGRDAMAIAEHFFNRLRLAGETFHIVSRSGSSLERTLFDRSVMNDVHLDYVAGRRCLRWWSGKSCHALVQGVETTGVTPESIPWHTLGFRRPRCVPEAIWSRRRWSRSLRAAESCQ
jgi:hypothetical protein